MAQQHSLALAIANGPFMNEDFFVPDPGWRQYLEDHSPIIKTQSTIYRLTPDMINLTRLSIPQFLRYQRLNESLAFIVRILNDIPNDWYFNWLDDNSPPAVWIPTMDVLTDHYSMYQSTKTLNAA